jgi:C4-dicarboxylate-specific signal transduction histidine kinase
MGNNRLLHELELAFFGTITASVSHELNNVLSIINEYAGLLDDLVSADNKGKPLENARIKKIALNIAEQIKREQEIIKLLNRFAHRVDTPKVQFNLVDLVHDIIRLSQRFASLKKVSLEFTLPQESISITNNPFGVQHAIFLCLNLALDFSNSNDSISTLLDKEESQVIINVTSRPIDKNEETAKKMEFISLIINNVGGKINIILINDDKQIIKLFIPLSIPDRVRDNKEDSKNEH